MRCSHCVRSSISVCRIRARERHWRTCSGGIHASGSRPSASSSRSQRASSRSVLARRLRPRNARVSTGSARCATAPAATSASHTNSQPVHASTATSHLAPPKRSTHDRTAAGDASIRPRAHLPVSVSNASNVICLRCTSNPATIAIRASFAFRQLATARTISRRAGGGPGSCHLCATSSTELAEEPSATSASLRPRRCLGSAQFRVARVVKGSSRRIARPSQARQRLSSPRMAKRGTGPNVASTMFNCYVASVG